MGRELDTIKQECQNVALQLGANAVFIGWFSSSVPVHVTESTELGHSHRVYCQSVTSDKQGWASLVLRRPGQERAVLLQRVARPANVPLVGESYVARQRLPVRDRAEVSSARIGARSLSFSLSLFPSRPAPPALLPSSSPLHCALYI